VEEDGDSESEVVSQPQTQRRRISHAAEDGEVEDGEAEPTQDSSTEQMVRNLVRLALASEYSRTPIRRSDINTKGTIVHTSMRYRAD